MWKMKKKMAALLALALVAVGAGAQENKWFQDLKLSGYGMVQYQGQDKVDNEQNTFNLRLVRVALEGRAHSDFYYKAQMQINGNTSEGSSAIRLVDLFGEWQKFSFLRVKVGQFKRPFTFENPMHPITQGFMSYSQNVSKLAGFSDRTGEHASNGRDIGLQLQGDLLQIGGRPWLHYQVGVFNGEGINVKDKDNRKDIIGGVWVMPLKGLRLGAFGWTGCRAGVGNKNRYALSAEYAQNDWTVRSEYIHSQGMGADATAGDKADGIYGLAIVPIVKNKLHVKARYDLYRDQKNWSSDKRLYEVGADYVFSKNLQLNVEYARVNEHQHHTYLNESGIIHNRYNMVDVELDIRF